ncbi:MAG: EamA family transporter [Anaerolineales bacterium]|nr:EamA family transporter [Anaerolineales bacterium]
MTNWIYYSLITVISFTMMSLIFKKLTTLEPKSEIINFYFFFFSTLAISISLFFRQTKFRIPTKTLPLFLLLAIIAVFGNYASISAIRLAPNPGYVKGIQTLEVVLLTIASYFLFRSEITVAKVIGAILVVGGVILLSL